MSETTDTLVLVVSEETGQMSIVRAGKIHHNLSIQEMRKMINEYFFEEEEEKIKAEIPKTKFEKILAEGLMADDTQTAIKDPKPGNADLR